MLLVAGKLRWSRVPQFQCWHWSRNYKDKEKGIVAVFWGFITLKNCCRYPIVSAKNIRRSINWSVGPDWCVAELPWMCVIVNMLCAVRWPAVTNMELMLWTQIVVYFENTFTFTRLRVYLTMMPPRHCPQLRHGSRRHRHRPRLGCDAVYFIIFLCVVCSAVIGSHHQYRVSHNTKPLCL